MALDWGYNDSPEEKALQQSSNSGRMSFKDMNADNVLEIIGQRADAGDTAALDYIVKYYLDQRSENSARSYNAMREDTAYQRLMADLKKAGISPYGLTPSLTPINGSSGFTASGNSYTSARNTTYSKSMDTVSKFAQIIGSVVSAITVAMIMAA